VAEDIKVTVLGCGGSGGVPTIGPDWGQCDPKNPKNHRKRASILIETRGKRLLVDTGPDLREQLLAAHVPYVDAILYTHAHADHVHGIDDLRNVCKQKGTALEAFGTEKTLQELQQRFPYAFEPLKANFFYKPQLIAKPILGAFQAADIPVFAFTQDHGFGMVTLGFRVGDFAYSTDVKHLDDSAFEALSGIKCWVVDCIQEAEHPTHSHFQQTLGWIERVGVQEAYLTHMNPSLDYHETLKKCPPHVKPAYDGLVVTL